MSLDLDEIRERSMLTRDGFYHVVGRHRCIREADFDALVAEVERLRGEVSYPRACVPPTRPTDYGHEVWTAALRAEVAAERAAVVAWLREPGEYVDPACARLADAIERGEHRREEEP
jgi:hypothetical protein